jgi:hypothetical protein
MPRQRCLISRAGKAVHVILQGDGRLPLPPQLFRDPVQHRPPLEGIEERRLIEWQCRNLKLATAHGLPELIPPLGRGRLPPVVHGNHGLGGPMELQLGRAGLRGQHSVKCDVQVTPL